MKSMLLSLLKPASSISPCFSDGEDEDPIRNQETPISLNVSTFEAPEEAISILNSPETPEKHDENVNVTFPQIDKEASSPEEDNELLILRLPDEDEPGLVYNSSKSHEHLESKVVGASFKEGEIAQLDRIFPFPFESTFSEEKYFVYQNGAECILSDAIQNSSRLYSHFICWWSSLEDCKGGVFEEMLKKWSEDFPFLFVQALKASGLLLYSINSVTVSEYEDFIHMIVQDMDSSDCIRIRMGIIKSLPLAEIFLPPNEILNAIIGTGLCVIIFVVESSFSRWESYEQIFFWKLLLSACFKLGSKHSYRILTICHKLLQQSKEICKDTSEFMDGILFLIIDLCKGEQRADILFSTPFIDGDKSLYIASLIEAIMPFTAAEQ
ncbi:hypothetical protein DI09_3p110 [Mitosporidium daphniae]|uniref:Uncharacterized protein n=1 Tax=Mitosporidium daphniae TaxID=1485682 RepID=A0A098VQZ7_9MICR|nr:uncharacterized protein DI09_3p110 [Mitosporidium daphniae]KGG51249.1 hypothetical protein DI09_3p110 [Mitosporidium daphniae]|eukprot:XP_013237676.1 uncharacterized protein DI09_3p110 [Mitosporidium daphniae]